MYELFEPLLWFWKRVEWTRDTDEPVKHNRAHETASQWTRWLIIAADFYYSTGIPMIVEETRMNEVNIEEIVNQFRRASKTLWRLAGGKQT